MHTAAAQAAIDKFAETARLDNDDRSDNNDLWHLLAGLLDWCDSHQIDFDALLSEVRDDLGQMAGRNA